MESIVPKGCGDNLHGIDVKWVIGFYRTYQRVVQQQWVCHLCEYSGRILTKSFAREWSWMWSIKHSVEIYFFNLIYYIFWMKWVEEWDDRSDRIISVLHQSRCLSYKMVLSKHLLFSDTKIFCRSSSSFRLKRSRSWFLNQWYLSTNPLFYFIHIIVVFFRLKEMVRGFFPIYQQSSSPQWRYGILLQLLI